MKKVIVILTAIMVLLASTATAEDLSTLTDEELIALQQEVLAEMERRGISGEEDGSGDQDEAATEQLIAFFFAWHENRMDDMLALCASDWKAGTGDPRMELVAILANRTPVSLDIETVTGEPEDPERTVQAAVQLDRNNGTTVEKYRFHIRMEKEEDGIWYVDPMSLTICEKAEEEPLTDTEYDAAEEADGMTDDTVLYYIPEGGEYYHLDRYCKTVNEKYLPMEYILYADLEDEKYSELKPCPVCCASVPGTDESRITFREAVDAAGENPSVGGDDDFLAVVWMEDGGYFRAVTILDDYARELYQAAMEGDDFIEAIEAFDAYAWELPVSYTEEFTALPKEQAELEALEGKTIAELTEKGYVITAHGGCEDEPVVFTMAYGLYEYEFIVDVTFEEYLDREEEENYSDLKTGKGTFSGFSAFALDLKYHADGTQEPAEE